jgi:DNA-binding NtrC family response regulator
MQVTTTAALMPDAPFTRQGPGALLVVVDGPERGQTARLGLTPVVVGSDAGCDLVLSDRTISRRHLQLTWKEGVTFLVDLESKNGSFFAGRRFHKLEASYGDEVLVGKCLLRILPIEEPLAPAEAGSENFGGLVGASPAMRQLFTLIDQLAASAVCVLIEGETGVGKELVAEEIHRRSPRRNRPFVVFDCGAVPSELIESTLFGHVRGAFTGATVDQAGIFTEADGGTLFLDEIGELRPELQPALLRALDRGMVRPVGATRYQRVDVRVLAATHRQLSERIAAGAMRQDLYYRLAVVRVTVPPLRDRREDIPLLVRHFLRRLGRPDLRVDDATHKRLAAGEWPGNVRELANCVERAVALSRDGRLQIDVPEPDLGAIVAPENFRLETPELRSFRDAKAEAVERFERAYLTQLMAGFDRLSKAAVAAGMDRRHLRILLRRYGLLPRRP